MKAKKWIGLLAVGILVLTAALGCSAQRKPNLGQGNPPAPTAPAPSTPLPTNPTESNTLAQRLASEAQKVNGVESATVVLTGSTALVGVNLRPGADAVAVKSEVASAIKRADNRVKNALVSTDPELNQRIIQIGKGIAGGRPISAFAREVDEILKRLSPSSR